MSTNKMKYFEVTTIVRAENQADALAVVRGRRGLGELLTTEVFRISAADAQAALLEEE